MEPGQAIEWALSVTHPFSVPCELDPTLTNVITELAANLPQLVQTRLDALALWEQRAHQLLPESVRRIRALPDAHLRRLLLGCGEHQTPQLGQVCHVALYEAMLHARGSPDTAPAQQLLHGFSIVGPIARSGRWPDYNKVQKVHAVEDALVRAWDLRQKIVARVKAVPVSDNLQKIWDATIEDCQEGSSVGPLASEEEVSEFLSCEDWIPTQRFEVVQ